MKRRFSLLEVVLSLAFVTVIALITGVILRTIAVDTAATAAANRLDRSLTQAASALRDELRYASAGSIQLIDLSPTSVHRGIEFQVVTGLGDDGAATTTATRRIEVNASKEFVLTGAGPTRILGIDAAATDDVDGPGLAFSQSSAESVEYTIRVRGLDPETGAVQTRSFSGRVLLQNP